MSKKPYRTILESRNISFCKDILMKNKYAFWQLATESSLLLQTEIQQVIKRLNFKNHVL